jgi:Zinc carboxypeptidase
MHVLQLCLLSLLGCASAVGAQVSEPAQEPAEPIRFGDGGGHVYGTALLPPGAYDPDLPTPESLLGRPWGQRIASHEEILRALRTWAEASPRATLETYGTTHEGRELVTLVITSEANQGRLAELRAGLARLSDPRGLTEAEGSRLVRDLPACAWMGYSIHGDETSGADAAPLVAYRLIAGQDAEVKALLDEVVVVMDPCLNPDGRERIRAMTHWMSGYRTNLNHESLHRGRWPYGRGNHYLFDMNRDWMAGVCPETRGRWQVLSRWRPQLFVDAHEMSALDTFLFYPQAAPLNAALPPYLTTWQGRFADDAGAAFDDFGWGYYTREWADAWYPGYSDSWGSLNGAIGMLYEQAGLGGQPLRRASGVIETYAQSVHGQVVASLANLETLRAGREQILSAYLADRRACVDPQGLLAGRTLVLRSDNAERLRRLVGVLEGQGIEVSRAGADFTARDVVSAWGEASESLHFDHDEVLLVAGDQPQARLIKAYFDLDPRIDDETLRDERARLERGEGSRLYDVTAWDLARQFGIDAWWCSAGDLSLDPSPPLAAGGAVVGETDGPAYAWAVDSRDDGSLRFLARAFELGVKVHASDRPFTFTVIQGGEARERSLARGSLLIRRHENSAGVGSLIAAAAAQAGVDVLATTTGRSRGEAPDLGGQHFHLLHGPRVAMVSGEPCSSSDFGNLWHHLDVDLGLAVTLLEARDLGSYDLRRYDVLILPPGGLGTVLEDAQDSLTAWVEAGGTLIACGGAANALAAGGELTSVKRRRDVLDGLEAYEFAARQQGEVGSREWDPAEVWDGEAPPPTAEDESEQQVQMAPGDGIPAGHPDADRQDAWMRRFMPSGTILRGAPDPEHWLTVGCGDELPILFRGRTALVLDGRAPVRFEARERLRLAGLLWPEARVRLDGAVWLSQEGRGHGQVILFATNPVFRGSTRATARAFSNAVLLGPGLGADPALDW